MYIPILYLLKNIMYNMYKKKVCCDVWAELENNNTAKYE